MGLNLRRVALLAGKTARGLARLAGLTPARADLLIELGRKARTQVDLAAQLCVSPPVVSRMLVALEKLGLVERTRRSGDRRYKLVSITDKAAELLERLRRIFLERNEEVQTRAESMWCEEWARALGSIEFEYILPQVSVTRLLRGMQHRNEQTDYFAYFAAGRRPPAA
jgi:DNA-binding MarR family transcriptional regulator